MIIDNLKDISIYYRLNDRIARGLRFLKENNLEVINPGRYEIEGSEIYMLVQEYKTKRIENCSWEAHRKYVDIQYIVKGVEKMGYANVNKLEAITEYDHDKDITFFYGTGDFFSLAEGEFAVFTPEDAHMPCLALDECIDMKKAVVKILL